MWSVDLETILLSRNFSQKRKLLPKKEQTTRKYLKLEIKIQVSSISDRVFRIEKQIRSFIFWKKLRIEKISFHFRDLLTFD